MKRYKVRRREEAQVRQELANKRTPQEQLKKLDQLGFRALREREKLKKRLSEKK